MAKTNIPFIMLDAENSHVPLYRQIYEGMRRAVLSGEFVARVRHVVASIPARHNDGFIPSSGTARMGQKRFDAFIVEDDYSSEFRYAGRPLASLQGLDKDGRVIYVGTLSKTIFPALRLGCVVVQKDLVEVFIAARSG